MKRSIVNLYSSIQHNLFKYDRTVIAQSIEHEYGSESHCSQIFHFLLYRTRLFNSVSYLHLFSVQSRKRESCNEASSLSCREFLLLWLNKLSDLTISWQKWSWHSYASLKLECRLYRSAQNCPFAWNCATLQISDTRWLSVFLDGHAKERNIVNSDSIWMQMLISENIEEA
jgi:hypothetical protein